MAERQKLAPDQYSPVESDLVFAAGTTRTVAPEDSAAPDELRLRGADADVGSGASGGDSLLTGGEGDGAGCRGRARIENTSIVMDQIVPAEVCPIGATQVALQAEDDGGDTEWFLDTPQGKIQVTKDGALNATLSTTTPAIDTSVSFDKLNSVSGGSPPPGTSVLNDYRVLDYPAGMDTEAVGQSVIRKDFRDEPGDVVGVIVKYTVGPGAGTTVRLQTFGRAGNTILPALNFDLDVSAVTPGDIVESPVLRTIPGVDINPLADVATVLKRLTFGGEYSGTFRLVSVVYRFKSFSVTVTLSESTSDFYTVPGEVSPAPSDLGAFKVVDYPTAVVREAVCFFTIPSGYQIGSDVQLRLCYAMDTLEPSGDIQISTELFINNVSARPPLSAVFFSTAPANEVRPTGLLRVIEGLQRLDSLAVRVRRTGLGSHTGTLRLVSAHLIMGSAVVSSTDLLEQTYSSGAESGFLPPTTTSEYVQADGEVYNKANGIGLPNRDVTFIYRGQVPSNRNEINFVSIPYKASSIAGNNGISIAITDESGAPVYGGPVLKSSTRAVETVTGSAILPNPGPGERFNILVTANVDAFDEIFVGAEITVGYS